MAGHLFTVWFTEQLKPTVETYYSGKKKKKKKERKNNVPDHPRAPLGMYNQSSIVFMSAKTTSIWQPIDQAVILTFKSQYLRNTFPKQQFPQIVISVMELGKVSGKPSGKDSPFQMPLKAFMIQNININKSLK